MNIDLRSIPQIEQILQKKEILNFIDILGHPGVTKTIREETEKIRAQIIKNQTVEEETLYKNIINALRKKKQSRLQRVINGTGVVIHTNLGRSPLHPKIIEKLQKTVSGYCNLEYDLHSQKRGKRGGFAEELICDLTGAEDALIVNNNASSVFLILNQFAKGKEVIISRSELIQIGGGFRIPDILNQSGAKLVEVGTTNITEIEDFKNAITEQTGMIFSAHQSNYSIKGFTKATSLKEMASLKNESILFVRDLGSGNPVLEKNLPANFEQSISNELKQGPDILCFSGDKLLGSTQAGIIIGKKELIAKLKKNPLMRMLRVDKITYFILQETLLLYANNRFKDVPIWEKIFQDKKPLTQKATSILKKIKSEQKKSCIKKIKSRATYGGGSMPTVEIESLALEISLPNKSPEWINSYFINEENPIIGIIENNRYKIDLFSIFKEEIPAIAKSIEKLLED